MRGYHAARAEECIRRTPPVGRLQLARTTLESIPVARRTPTESARQHLWVDSGYDYDEVRRLAEEFHFTLHLPRRGHDARTRTSNSRKQARRWMVERGHSWLNRFRRLLVRWEKREDTYLGMLHLALGIITWFHALLPK